MRTTTASLIRRRGRKSLTRSRSCSPPQRHRPWARNGGTHPTASVLMERSFLAMRIAAILPRLGASDRSLQSVVSTAPVSPTPSAPPAVTALRTATLCMSPLVAWTRSAATPSAPSIQPAALWSGIKLASIRRAPPASRRVQLQWSASMRSDSTASATTSPTSTSNSLARQAPCSTACRSS